MYVSVLTYDAHFDREHQRHSNGEPNEVETH